MYNKEIIATNEEIKIITNTIKQIGDPYSFLRINLNSTSNQITERYNQIVNELRKENSQKNEMLIGCCVYAYSILSNDRIRTIYDSEYYEKTIKKKEKKWRRFNKFIFLLLKSAEYFRVPIDVVLVNKANPNVLESSTRFIIDRYKENGMFSFLQGTFYSLLDPLITRAIGYPIKKVRRLLFKDCAEQKENNLKSALKWLQSLVIPYPSKFILECIMFSPWSMSTFEIIRKVILRENGGQFQFKNLFYSFTSTISILIIRKIISNSLRNIESLFMKGYEKNPNSNKWKFSAIFYCNPITQGILTALLLRPLEVIRIQYPYEFVQSYLKNTQIPNVINPIAMAFKVYKQKGPKFFFSGLSIAIPYYATWFLVSPIKTNNIYSY